MMDEPPFLSFRILLIEDNPGDVRLTMEALRSAPFPLDISVARDGIEGLRFLRRLAPFEGAARPDLILLDLALPRKDGREVLEEVKEDPEFRGIPVIVLTSSASEADVDFCYRRHANCYIAKTSDPAGFARLTEAVGRFWCGTAILPPRAAPTMIPPIA
jgi:CheY-like chemotaxis protein